MSLNYLQLTKNEHERYENDDASDENNISPGIYDIITIPNDFNTKTIVDFIESDSFVIPDFQRNYVWSITHASKFIESVIMGLPIPQIFLYEKKQNKFLVIDGQQRLMSLYYFVNGKFPKKAKISDLRVMSDSGQELKNILRNKDYFTDFKLHLPKPTSDESNPLDKFTYQST